MVNSLLIFHSGASASLLNFLSAWTLTVNPLIDLGVLHVSVAVESETIRNMENQLDVPRDLKDAMMLHLPRTESTC